MRSLVSSLLASLLAASALPAQARTIAERLGHPRDAKWRQMDYDVMTSPAFRQALKDDHVVLVTWRDVQKATYPTP